MFGEWFQKYPEHLELKLPLPSDPAVNLLTTAQIDQLGVAIEINQADPAAKHSQVAKLDALIAALVQAKGKPHRRASQAIEVEESDWTDSAQCKSTKSLCMQLHTHIVQALWKEASVEEQKEVAAQVEKEREEIHKAELKDEEKGSEPQTPAQLQDGIDALEGLFTKVHSAAYVTSNWVGMTIVSGPNPRLGGDLSMKNIVKAFKGFLQLVFSPSECRARAFEPREAANDPLRPATVNPPPSPEELVPLPAKKTAKKKTTSRKVVNQTATSSLNSPWLYAHYQSALAVCTHTLTSIPNDTMDANKPSDLDRDLTNTQDINIDFEDINVNFGAEEPGTYMHRYMMDQPYQS
ncbi:hypothetical protein B0H14DRAFT_3431993 [Mycena olivaceomarginata]|nr:hypothetical protein B0H14DRAFT_3431993 [Mycena olivaceomarginata]